MSRIVKCAHIQAANARHEGTPAKIKEAMIEKHIPLIEEAGEKGFRFSARRRFSMVLISAPNRTSSGMPRPKKFQDRPLNGWLSMQKNTAW